jgi:outer membrane phospholipase A
MRWAALLLMCHAGILWAQAPWILSSPQGRAVAGERFSVVVVAPGGAALPEEIALRVNTATSNIIITLQASGPAQDGRRAYGGRVPPAAAGAATLTLDELPSNELVLLVTRRDAVGALTTGGHDDAEPPLQENEPTYFVMGVRDGVTARFQLSFKYRLFDYGSGFGQERPWLAGFYFAYTQTSTWDLSSDSKAFRDTSYRPSLFWKWERTDDRTWIDGARLGAEHESNGRDGPRSRSINVLFLQPEWRWTVGGGNIEFAPRVKRYLDKEENPDIEQYRGHVDWKLRYDTGGNWIASALARTGTAGKGSVQLDLARRTRDLKFGPISGYVYLQYFNGWGEDILDYNVRRNSQIRVGFAIVP